MSTTALIADDEEAPRAQLVAALASLWPDLKIAAEATNGIDAWDCYLEREPQVCFLDVRMPGLTGVEVAQRIAGRAHVVFVAAHADHALAVFDAGGVDYVVKPIDVARLSEVVAHVRTRLESGPADLHRLLDQVMRQVRRPAYAEAIQVGVGIEKKIIRVDDVIYLESEQRHTRLVFDGGSTVIRTPLKEMLGRLDATKFWQIHRSVIVNRRCIAAVERTGEGNMVVMLRGRPERLTVSQHFQPLFADL